MKWIGTQTIYDRVRFKKDISLYSAINNGNPTISLGSSATERLEIKAEYESGAQGLDLVRFTTYTAGSSTNDGRFGFYVDEIFIASILDDGLNIGASKNLSIGGVDILTDSSGTTTLNNIDALDAATIATFETALEANIDTLNGSITIDTDRSAAQGNAGAEDITALHIDFDRTVPGSGTYAHNDTGIDLDVTSASLGTSSLKGMDIDVIGTTSGTSTATGIDLLVRGADAAVGMQIMTGGTHLKLIAGTDVNDYATFTVADTGDLTIETVGDGSIDSDLTLDADGQIKLEPAAGKNILLDGTIAIDAGVVTGASSITSDFFIGNLTGQADTVATIAGLAPNTATTQATQSNITSLGTLTGLILDGAKGVTPGDGAMIHVDASTITDNNTSGSGTADLYAHVRLEGPTLAATNSSVTTTDAATLYIPGAPSAGTNQTITNAYGIYNRVATRTGGLVSDGAITSTGSYSQTAGDMTLYDANNDGNPTISLGSSATNRLEIKSTYNSGAQTLCDIDFTTYTSSGTGNDGRFNWYVDEVLLALLNDNSLLVYGNINANDADATITANDSTTSSATQGGKIKLMSDDSAAMGDDHRLGVIEFHGAEDGSNNKSIGARIQAICRDAWDGSNNDADLEFYTTDGTTESKVLTLDADKLATFTGGVTVAGTLTCTTDLATDQQKHLMHYQLVGYAQGDGTNYEIEMSMSDNNAPFEHNISTGSDGLTAVTVATIARNGGGPVMPRACTLKMWTGWGTCSGSGTVYIGLFKVTPTRDDNTNLSAVLLHEFSYTAMGNNKMEDFNETSFTATAIAAGDILITGLKSDSGFIQYVNSTVEVEF